MKRKITYALGTLIAVGVGFTAYQHYYAQQGRAPLTVMVPSERTDTMPESPASPLQMAISEFISQNTSASHSEVIEFANRKLTELGYPMTVLLEKFDRDDSGDYINAPDGTKLYFTDLSEGPCGDISINPPVTAFDKNTVSILHEGQIIRIKGSLYAGTVARADEDKTLATISVPYEGAAPGVIAEDAKSILFKVSLSEATKGWWAKTVSTTLQYPFLLLEFREDGFRFSSDAGAYEKYEDEPHRYHLDSEDYDVHYENSKMKFHIGICT